MLKESKTGDEDRPQTRMGVVKNILRASRSMGAVSFTYHVIPAFHSPETSIPRLLFSNAWPNKSSASNMRFRRHIEKVHDVIISEGLPINYLSLMAGERLVNSIFAQKLQSQVADLGIIDEYIIPVYGPYKIEGCMCFGFGQDVFSLEKETRCKLEMLAAASHVKIVASFYDKMKKIQLSERETEVLQWLALGKSLIDIATILDVKPATIDSYTRRIYAKFGVHNKIGAVLAGVSTGKISL